MDLFWCEVCGLKLEVLDDGLFKKLSSSHKQGNHIDPRQWKDFCYKGKIDVWGDDATGMGKERLVCGSNWKCPNCIKHEKSEDKDASSDL